MKDILSCQQQTKHLFSNWNLFKASNSEIVIATRTTTTQAAKTFSAKYFSTKFQNKCTFLKSIQVELTMGNDAVCLESLSFIADV